MPDIPGSPEPNEAERQVFNLDEQLLAKYPEMAPLSGFPVDQAPTDTFTISAAFVNGRTVDHFIDEALRGKPSGDVGYLIDFVDMCLGQIKSTGKPEYERFIEEETRGLKERKGKAAEALGWRQRGSDGVYR